MVASRGTVSPRIPWQVALSLWPATQQRYPGQFPDVQVRSLQRRIARWRATVSTTFDDQWREEVLADAILPRPLQAAAVTAIAAHGAPMDPVLVAT